MAMSRWALQRNRLQTAWPITCGGGTNACLDFLQQHTIFTPENPKPGRCKPLNDALGPANRLH